jgi:hypothetical protein
LWSKPYTILVFVWNSRGKPQKSSVRLAGIPGEWICTLQIHVLSLTTIPTQSVWILLISEYPQYKFCSFPFLIQVMFQDLVRQLGIPCCKQDLYSLDVLSRNTPLGHRSPSKSFTVYANKMLFWLFHFSFVYT